jgi:hypothetical protein
MASADLYRERSATDKPSEKRPAPDRAPSVCRGPASYVSERLVGGRVGDPDLAVDLDRAELVASLLVERAVIEASVPRCRMFELVDERLRVAFDRGKRPLDVELVGDDDLSAPQNEPR